MRENKLHQFGALIFMTTKKIKRMKARLSCNVKLSKAKQETNVCSANHFLLRALCVTWCMKSSLFSLKQIEMIHGGK